MELNERKLKIMLAIVDDYIASGIPIGSRTLSRMWGGQLSAATIRNEMSDLEEMGFLVQPHTSAGRIPSDLAYRLYVDRFLQVATVSEQEDRRIREYFTGRMRELDNVLATTARVLSEMTNYVGMILPPEIHRVTIAQIKLISVTKGRALAVLVTNQGIVKDMMFEVPNDVDQPMLDRLSEVLSEQMHGHTMDEFPHVMHRLQADMNVHESLFHSLIDVVGSTQPARTVVFDGRQNLLKHQEHADIERAKTFLQAMDSQEMFYHMLKDAKDMEMTISIGSENAYDPLKDASVVTATYTIGGKRVGSFGIIGPTRMDYGRVVAVMKHLSQALEDILSG